MVELSDGTGDEKQQRGDYCTDNISSSGLCIIVAQLSLLRTLITSRCGVLPSPSSTLLVIARQSQGEMQYRRLHKDVCPSPNRAGHFLTVELVGHVPHQCC